MLTEAGANSRGFFPTSEIFSSSFYHARVIPKLLELLFKLETEQVKHFSKYLFVNKFIKEFCEYFYD